MLVTLPDMEVTKFGNQAGIIGVLTVRFTLFLHFQVVLQSLFHTIHHFRPAVSTIAVSSGQKVHDKVLEEYKISHMNGRCHERGHEICTDNSREF